jgi:hypothetical protein
MDAGCSRQSDYSAVELSGAHLYAVVMVRILLMFALVVTVSLKHFERAPAYTTATTDSFSELLLPAGISVSVVEAPDCADNHDVAGNLRQSHKSDCKAVIGKAAVGSIAALDDPLLPVHDTSTVSTMRPVDLPPPRA